MKSFLYQGEFNIDIIKSLYTCKNALSGSRGLLDISHCVAAFFINFLRLRREFVKPPSLVTYIQITSTESESALPLSGHKAKDLQRSLSI